MKHRIPYTLFIICFANNLQCIAQLDTLDLPTSIEYQIESHVEQVDSEVPFDYDTQFEALTNYLEKPINLNIANEQELIALNLLHPLQITSLLHYRKKNGLLLSLYELQAIPNFDLPTIHQILPFVRVNKSLDDLNETFASLLEKSKKRLYLRWGRSIEIPKGYQSPKAETPPAYLGDINKYYCRYSQTYGNRISTGFTLEKDSGEHFFKGSNTQGFDFMSFHFIYKKVNKVIERIVLGDFNALYGQGLILNTGFSPGKGAVFSSLKKAGPVLNKFSSVNEQNFFRGGGLVLDLHKHWQLSLFLSARKRDGKFNELNSLDESGETNSYTSLQLSGLHRTKSEIANKDKVKQFSTGVHIKHKTPKGHIALNVLYNQFDQKIGKAHKPYNKFAFSGQSLLNASIDYSFNVKNLLLFGETAWSDNQAMATTNGLLINLHPKVSYSCHYRFFPKNFHSLYGQTFSESSGVNNETGIYMGLEIRPRAQWRILGYIDQWKHPWLRFRADAPSRGRESLARITFYKRKKMEAYIQWKKERKQESYRLDNTKVDALLYKEKESMRIHLSKKISKGLELRSRVEWSLFDIEKSHQSEALIWYQQTFTPQNNVKKSGYLVYQDIIYKPSKIPISITGRYAIFDIDNYDTRIYAYENDVTYQFSIPAYYNKGTRFYLNLKYRAKNNIVVESRIAQTYWANQLKFGSGNEEIKGQTKTSVKVQLRLDF